MSTPKKNNPLHFFYDFAIIIGVSFTLYFGLTYLGAPLWFTLAVLVTWGAITGYKPHLFRKPFWFLYKE
jgi:hypothetical protein